MLILNPVSAQLGQITLNVQHELSHCCVPHYSPHFPNDRLCIEALCESISSFVLLACFSVASF